MGAAVGGQGVYRKQGWLGTDVNVQSLHCSHCFCISLTFLSFNRKSFYNVTCKVEVSLLAAVLGYLRAAAAVGLHNQD